MGMLAQTIFSRLSMYYYFEFVCTKWAQKKLFDDLQLPNIMKCWLSAVWLRLFSKWCMVKLILIVIFKHNIREKKTVSQLCELVMKNLLQIYLLFNVGEETWWETQILGAV